MHERWQQVEDLARHALERPSQERRAFLDAACRDVPELRSKVDELVAAYEQQASASGGTVLARTVLSRPGFVPPPAVELGPGRQVACYRIIDEAGEGSMARIYRARPADGGRPIVALKVARHGFDLASLVRLFKTERQTLQRIDHPNVAHCYGGGTLMDGRPYVVLEFVDGWAVHEHCQRLRLPLEERLTLFRQICAAVEAAHGQGLIHRDVKPSNVLVTKAGVPKLLDFGIAVDLEQSDVSSSSSTDQLMTPQYASPEQLRGIALTPRCDVYALGVVLYELLTDRLPCGVLGMGPREMLREIDKAPPRPPSFFVTDDKAERRLVRELDAVVLKALSQDLEGRYESAAELRSDLECWLKS